MDLTMRVVMGLLEQISENRQTVMYDQIIASRLATLEKLPSKEEIFGVPSGEETKVFDDETDAKLEALALKKLEELKKKHG